MWWIVLPILLIGPIGTFVVYLIPNMYRSRTVILVEPQKIDPNFVRNPITIPVKDKINQIRNKILSSTNLDVILNKFGLFQDQMVKLNHEAEIELLRRRIDIFVDHHFPTSELSQVSYFSISYVDKDPGLAQKVCAEVAAQFLLEEEKQSKLRILSTSTFIDAQLEERIAELEAKRRELSQARLQSMVNMPLDAATYARQLDSIETEISGARDSIERWEEKLQGLERDLTTTPKTIERQVQVYDEASQSEPEPIVTIASAPPPADYSALEAELARLRRTYTDNHPDVRRILRQIESFKAQQEANSKVAEAKSKVNEEQTNGAAPTFKSVSTTNPVFRRLTSQAAQVKRTVVSQRSKLQSLLKQKSDLEVRLAQWPRATQTIADKTAEISLLETEYNSLKAKQQDARLSVELINRAQAEQFRVQDPASRPESPVESSRPRLYLTTWLVAVGVGLFLALARDVTDQAIRTPLDLRLLSTAPVLASIPRMLTPQEKYAQRRQRNLLYGLYALFGLIVVSGTVYAALNQTIKRQVIDYISVYFV
jgi:polysaccharide chain length determinant protein (PEP-CTERM system associated)